MISHWSKVKLSGIGNLLSYRKDNSSCMDLSLNFLDVKFPTKWAVISGVMDSRSGYNIYNLQLNLVSTFGHFNNLSELLFIISFNFVDGVGISG